MIDRFIKRIKVKQNNDLWKKANANNFTTPGSVFPVEYVQIGRGTYGTVDVRNDVPDIKVKIGNYCSIAGNVLFISGRDHSLNNLSTYPFQTKLLKSVPYEAISKGDIVVDDDVWIGQNVTILSGVHIGQGAVIAAGSVVSKDVPPYAIVGGTPARVIKYRFSKSIIRFLLTLDYGSLTDVMVKEHIDALYTPIGTMELDSIEKLFDWFPKR